MTGSFAKLACHLLRAAAVLALLGAGAYAQFQMPGINLDPDGRRTRVLTPEEQEKEKAIDEKYKATMKGMPDKKPPTDPWGNIRSSSGSGTK